jgi:predicted Zn-dependent protease
MGPLQRRIARGTRKGAMALLSLTIGLHSIAACARNPVTGQRELSLISEEQEIAMGQQGAQEVVQSIGLVDDQRLQQYVNDIGTRLARASERPNLPWSFRVVDDPSPNAFALPGGFIFVTRGLLGLMNSEAELASVIGHEIGHVTAKHSVSQLSRAQVAQIGLGIGSILSPTVAQLGQVAGAGLQLLFLKYGRDDERQADELGFRYALAQNYDPREFDDVFRALQRVGESSGGSALPTWLATHPGEAERIQSMEQRAAALNRPVDNLVSNEQNYMRTIEGLIYGANPRNGFFQGITFVHPDLRFRFDLPQGWQGQNLAQAVVGVSPQQDAVLQLTLAQGSDPASAARAFLSQQGIRAGQTFQESINGVPAAGSYFEAQTEQGVIQGIVAFFTYGGRTFQLMTYTPGGKLQQYDALFRRSVASFAPLTDQRLLNVQPSRIDVVQVPQAMTLAQFNAQNPSSIPITELALINALPSETAQIPAGALVKRVATQ